MPGECRSDIAPSTDTGGLGARMLRRRRWARWLPAAWVDAGSSATGASHLREDPPEPLPEPFLLGDRARNQELRAGPQ